MLTIEKDTKMSNRFLKNSSLKKISFSGEQVEIKKLSAAHVLDIQAESKRLGETPSEQDNLSMMLTIITLGCPEVAELERDEILQLPLDDLNKLSNEIMKHSGLLKEGK
jgi:hypothetical protein